jgi:hypothetical protein
MNFDISIVQLGQLKRQINFRSLQQWKSKIFKINSVSEISHIPNSESIVDWQYLSDEVVRNSVERDDNAKITMAITEYSLEGNFYMRRIDKGLIIISFFEVGDILRNSDIPVENFILRNIYEIVALTYAYPDLPNTSDGIPDIIHEETRSCLFDISGIKTDIVYSSSKPSLCPQCEANLQQKQLPKDFVNDLTSEIKKIRKPLFNRISDFIKYHPIWAIIIGITTQFCIGLIAGLVANYLYYMLNF